MKVKNFVFNPLRVNTYLLIDDTTKETIIIDPACQSNEEKQALDDYVTENGLIVKKAIYTHLHFDHIYGSRFVYEKYGAGIEGAEEDRFFLDHYLDFLALFGMPLDEDSLPLSHVLKEGDHIQVGSMDIIVFSVPGHSPGGLAFYSAEDNCVFVGDSILEGGIGRTDLHKGNFDTLVNCIKTKLLTLPEETVVYSGHGRASTIKLEKENNPYLQ